MECQHISIKHYLRQKFVTKEKLEKSVHKNYTKKKTKQKLIYQECININSTSDSIL